ncbi:hypothetical protein LSH36_447g03002 [Paralvinella palmiformis]|uniref:Uncharacterized protein n=1 Tax=Paralvinella palmiformis TaxID=53620 RepID=A0AAD9MZK6_9ANNE|nr:hypothetical protein LSH36_447g03002 [Paralvinella palmiformis]
MPDRLKSKNHLDQPTGKRTDSASKRFQARSQLETRLRGRKSQTGPELDMIGFGSPDAPFRRLSAHSKTKPDRKDQDCDAPKSSGSESRYITLSQAHNLLGPIRKNQLSTSTLPDIRIRIIPVLSSCQSIKLTMTNPNDRPILSPLKENVRHDGLDRSRSALVASSKDTNVQDTSSRRRNGAQCRSASEDVKIKAAVSAFDKNQMKPEDMILRWLADNPLVTETNCEYETALSTDMTQIRENIRSRRAVLPRTATEDHDLTANSGTPTAASASTITMTATINTTSTTTTTTNTNHTTRYLLNSTKELATPSLNSFTLPTWPRNRKPDSSKSNQPIGNRPSESRDHQIPSLSLGKLHRWDGDHGNGQKQKKSVRFGSRDWIIKDDTYLFH